LNGFPLVFSNPWGALALLGLPAVVVIHCLQQKSRALKISTLFLLERHGPDSKEGRRLTWMRGSPAFWLQVLCILILTWLLLEPRWIRTNAVQRVVVVVDSSLSMEAFKSDLVERIASRLHSLTSLAPRTYWTLSDTDSSHPQLYEGFDLGEMEEKLRTWSPSLPYHDLSGPLELARSLAPPEAVVILVTDRPREVPNGVDLLEIGEPIENCGLVGLRLSGTGDDLGWQVLVHNYGQKPAHRNWWIEMEGRKTDPEPLDLEPGHSKVLKGKFPPGLDRLTVCLDGDRFSLDDRMPIARPVPKRLSVDLRGDDSSMDLFVRLTQTLPALAAARPGEPADLAFVTIAPQTLIPEDTRSSVVLFNDPGSHTALEGEPFVVENDPLNEDLNWQGLIIQPNAPIKPDPRDHVLLWKDHNPVIYIRTLSGSHQQLIFNFNFPASNATRLPAFVLLIERFLETIRKEKSAPEVGNTELSEQISLAADAHGGTVTMSDSAGNKSSLPAQPRMSVRAPVQPGFFSLVQDGNSLFSGAAGFGDARESDFSPSATGDTLTAHQARQVELNTRSDMFTPLWIVLIGVLLISYWAITRLRQS